MIDAILSDLGNVLLTFDNEIFFRALAARSRLTAAEIGRIVGENVDLAVLFEKGAVSEIDFYRNAKDLFATEADFGEFFTLYCDVFTLNRPVLEIYRRLRPGLKTVLVSNTDIMRWTFIKRRFPEILIFDAYALSFELGAMKPDPLVYREALALIGGRPESAVFIDDLTENAAGAERMGIQGIVYGPETNLAAALSRLGLLS
jgi:putative hydrolase of the HAD superfamily